LWNVRYSRYTDTIVYIVYWNVNPSWRRMCILISRLAMWPLTLRDFERSEVNLPSYGQRYIFTIVVAVVVSYITVRFTTRQH